MPQLPIVLPFVLQGFTFTDTRTDPVLKMRASEAFQQFVQSTIPPRDLLCSAGSVRAFDQQLARNAAWDASGNQFVEGTPEPDIDGALLDDELEKARAIDSLRHTVEIFRGDRAPVNFALTQGSNFRGAWQMYGIRIVSEDRDLIEARAGWFPVLLDTTTEEFANRSIDIVDQFVRRPLLLELEDGRDLDFVQLTASTAEDGGRPDTEIIKFARERLERNAGRGQLKFTKSNESGGRERFRVTAFDRDPIDEPEIDELEATRR